MFSIDAFRNKHIKVVVRGTGYSGILRENTNGFLRIESDPHTDGSKRNYYIMLAAVEAFITEWKEKSSP